MARILIVTCIMLTLSIVIGGALTLLNDPGDRLLSPIAIPLAIGIAMGIEHLVYRRRNL